jgi:hypothetical protein
MLANVLNIRGCRPVSFVAETIPELKSGNPFGGTTRTHRLRKLSRVLHDRLPVRDAANNQRAREEKPVDPATGEVMEFVAEPRKWGVRREGTPFADHKGATYLEVKVERSLQCEYRLDDGTPVDAATVAQWLPEKEEGRRQMVEPSRDSAGLQVGESAGGDDQRGDPYRLAQPANPLPAHGGGAAAATHPGRIFQKINPEIFIKSGPDGYKVGAAGLFYFFVSCYYLNLGNRIGFPCNLVPFLEYIDRKVL